MLMRGLSVPLPITYYVTPRIPLVVDQPLLRGIRNLLIDGIAASVQ